MLYKNLIVFSIFCTFLWAGNTKTDTSMSTHSSPHSHIKKASTASAKTDNSAMRYLTGAWHLRALDGMEVRKARAILDFDIDKMKLHGFDACNRISGTLLKHTKNNTYVPRIKSTRMGCRQNIHRWVSSRLHKTLKEGFFITEETKYGVEGITLKSKSHELFFKRMQKD